MNQSHEHNRPAAKRPKPDLPEHPQPEVSYPCPACQAGVLQLRYLTYYTRLHGDLITVPNFPAWVCDMCGHREDDGRARSWLNILLNPQTGRRKHSQPRQHPNRPRPNRHQRLG